MGYVTSIVTLNENAYKNNVLYLDIKWGRINDFTKDGKPTSFGSKSIIFFSYPQDKGDIVNINDIDQAIENSNSSFQSTKIKIVPSDKYGYSNIDYSYSKKYMPSVNSAINNSGNGNKNGRFKYDETINYGGLLNFNERYTVGLSARRFEKNDFVENNKFIQAGMPYGFYDLSVFYSESYSKNPLLIADQNFPYESELKSYYLNLKKKIYRLKYNSANIKAALNFKETKNYLDNSFLESSSNNYTDLVIGVDGTFSNDYGTFYLDSSYTQGLGINNSSKGSYTKNIGKDVYLFTGTLSYQKILKYSDNLLSLYSTSSYQYAGRQNLVNNYKSSIGDEYSLRGLNASTSMSYDSSIYINNTLTLPFIFSTVNISPFIGFDIGLGRDNNLSRAQYFYSGSSGLKLDYSIFNLSLTYGKLLYLSSSEVKSGVFYFNTAIRI